MWFPVSRRVGAALLLLLGAILAGCGSSHPAATPYWQADSLRGTLVHGLAFAGNTALAATHGGIYRRTPGGPWRRVLRSVEVWSVAALSPQRVIAAENAGTVALSTDGGRHWRRIPLAGEGVFAVAGRGRTVWAGAAGGIWRSTDGGYHWQHTLFISRGAVDALSPAARDTVYAGAVGNGPRAATLVYVSRDAGRTWQVFGRGLNSTGGVMSVAAVSGTLLAGTMGNAAWLAALAQPTWHKDRSGLPPHGDHVAALLPVPGHPGVVLAGTLGFGVYRSASAGRTWHSLTGSLATHPDAAIVTALLYRSGTRTIYAGTGDGVYRIALSALLPPR